MMFSKTAIAAAALCLGLTLQAHAHAAIAPALGIQGNPVRNDAQRPQKGKECGNVDIAKNFDSSKAVQAAANGSFVATITNFNGGIDGSRQVTALVDPTGTGKSFVSADVLQNGDKNPDGNASQQLVVQLPAGSTCTGGASKDKCLVSFTTAGGFGNCVVVQQAAGGAASGSGDNKGQGKGDSKGKGSSKATSAAAASSSVVSAASAASSAVTATSSAAAAAASSSAIASTSAADAASTSVAASASTSAFDPSQTETASQIDEELLKEFEALKKQIEDKLRASASETKRTVRWAKDM